MAPPKSMTTYAHAKPPKVKVDDVQWLHARKANTEPGQTAFGPRLCVRLLPADPETSFIKLNRYSLGLMTDLGTFHSADGELDFDSDAKLGVSGTVEAGARYANKAAKHMVFTVPANTKACRLIYQGAAIGSARAPAYDGPAMTAASKKSGTAFTVSRATVVNLPLIDANGHHGSVASPAGSGKAQLRYRPFFKGGAFIKVTLKGDKKWSTSELYMQGDTGGRTQCLGGMVNDGAFSVAEWGHAESSVDAGETVDVFFGVPYTLKAASFSLLHGNPREMFPAGSFKVTR